MEGMSMDTAVTAAGLAADPYWRALADAAIRQLAVTGDEFTTDDVWRLLAGFDTPEHRALGSLMREAHKAGLIRPLRKWRESTRVEAHKNPKRVWVGV